MQPRLSPVFLSVLTGVALLAFAIRPAQAAPITFNFSVTITSVDAPLAGAFSVGDVLAAALTFDSALLDANSALNVGSYQPISGLSVTGAGFSAALGAGGSQVQVVNSFSDTLSMSGGLTGAPVLGLTPNRLELVLVDGTGTAFANDALPSTISLGSFPTSRIAALIFDNPSTGTDAFVRGTITNIQVPEPGILALVAAGVVAAARRRWRSA